MTCKLQQMILTTEHYRYFPINQVLGTLARIGEGRIELSLIPPHVWVDWMKAEDLEGLRGILTDNGLAVSAVRPEWTSRRYLPFYRDGERARRSLLYYMRCCEIARALGAGIVSLTPFGPVLDENPEEAFERSVLQLKAICRQADALGVRIAMETAAPGWSVVADSLGALARLIDAVDEGALFATLDVVAMSEAGERIQDWFKRLGRKIAYVRFSDGRKGNDHLICGDGLYPVARYLDQLGASGYAGPVALPLGGSAADDPAAADARNMTCIRSLLAEKGA